MRRFQAVLTIPVMIVFEGDKATEKSAEFIAKKLAELGNLNPLKINNKDLGEIKAYQDDSGTVREVKKLWT